MATKPVTVTRQALECTCERCGNVWISDSEKIPIRCARCRTPLWNIPKRNPKSDVKEQEGR